MIRRKHYNAIGVDQDLDATCHSRLPGHNVSRKCKVFKRKTSKRMRRVLKEDLQMRLLSSSYRSSSYSSSS